MDEPWAQITKKIKNYGSNWTTYTVMGSFVLYVLGYLTLRFHLTALGVGTDLSVLDERYLFSGTRFLLYFISLVPSLLLFILLLIAPIYLPYHLLSISIRGKIKGFFYSKFEFIHSWFMVSNRLVWLGIIFALLMIQLVMRQCFLLSNLLLANNLNFIPAWLSYLLLTPNDWPIVLYFGALLLSVLISSKVFYVLDESSSGGLRSLLGFLLCVQLLLIPVNYGVLVIDKSMPRVTGLNERNVLNTNQQAWLVWEGNEGKTFLLREQKAGIYKKSLITLPNKGIKKVEISSYDRIFNLLFSNNQ